MKDWKSFSLVKKITIGVVIIIFANLSPELMLFMDVGGIEMAFSFLLLYYKSLLDWFQKQIDSIKEFLLAFHQIIINSSLMSPRVYFTHSVYSLCAMWLTGAVVFSMVFMLPALFVTGMIV
jgi:hypothetical protein